MATRASAAWHVALHYAEIITPRDTTVTVTRSGMGVTQDPNHRLMILYADGSLATPNRI